MAVLSKTLISHNLHKYTLELQAAFEQGWRVNPEAVARRSLGNRFSVVLTKSSEDVAPKVEVKEVETQEEKAADVTTTETPEVKEDAPVDTPVETPKVEAEAPVAPKPTRSKTKAKANEGEAE